MTGASLVTSCLCWDWASSAHSAGDVSANAFVGAGDSSAPHSVVSLLPSATTAIGGAPPTFGSKKNAAPVGNKVGTEAMQSHLGYNDVVRMFFCAVCPQLGHAYTSTVSEDLPPELESDGEVRSGADSGSGIFRLSVDIGEGNGKKRDRWCELPG